MQYPIIDNLIYAYQRNGWTGLTITEGKNLFDIITFLTEREARYTETDGLVRFDCVSPLYTNYYILSENNETYTMSVEMINNITSNNFRIELLNTNNVIVAQINEENLVNTGSGNKIRFNWSVGGTVELKNVQIEKGNQATPYEPCAPPTTDIAHRLKLPLAHYFPHPVIDALISAADGQQTEEENEILRHYLTPLGIGGI